MEFRQSSKLAGVSYEIRGPVIEYADQLEQAGHSVLRLNTGNPALFGFDAPEEILQDIIRNLPHAHGYSDSRGILPARRAVVQYYQSLGVADVDLRRVRAMNPSVSLCQRPASYPLRTMFGTWLA